MTECDECGFEAKSAAGLASHCRAKHPGRPVHGVSVADAVRRYLDGVEGPASLGAVAVTLAEAMDETLSARDLPSLSRELRKTLDALEEFQPPHESKVDELRRKMQARREARQ